MKHSFRILTLSAALMTAGVMFAEAGTFNLGGYWEASYDDAVTGMGTSLPYQLDEPQSSSQILLPASLLGELAPQTDANGQTLSKIKTISVQFCAQDVYGDMEGEGDFEVWIENTSATEFPMEANVRQWFEYSNGTHGQLKVDASELGIEYYEPFTLTIPLDESFVYEGESILLTFKGTCDFTESYGMEWYGGVFTFSPRLGVLSGMATDHKMSGKLTNTQSVVPYMQFAYETEFTQAETPGPVDPVDPVETAEYTIEFATAANNNGTTVDLSAVASGLEYVTDVTYSNSGVGMYGLKVGQNKNPGYVTFALADDAKVTPQSITMLVSANKNANKLAFAFNGLEYTLNSSAINDAYETITIDNYGEALESLSFARNASSGEGFFFVKSITVKYAKKADDPVVDPEPETPAVYLANGEEVSVKLAAGMMAGIQLDVEMPEGVSFTLTSPDAAKMTFSEQAISNTCVRYVAYTNDGQTIETEFTGVIAATNAERAAVEIRNIILSVDDVPVAKDEMSVPVLGYQLTGFTLPDVETGDVVTLPAPNELPYSDVAYTWKEYESELATVDTNGVLTALREGTINDLGFEINDPMIGQPLLAYASLNIVGRMGDVDGSGMIDIADVVCMVNYILMKNPENFIFKYADLDNSGDINVADVTRLVKLVLAQPKLVASAEGSYRLKAADSEFTVSSKNSYMTADGKMHVYVSINKQRADYTGVQLDLELNNNLHIEGIRVGNSLSNHKMRYASVDETTTRVVLYSTSLATLPVDEALLDITLAEREIPAGSGMTICSAISADIDGETYFHPMSVNKFEGIITGISDATVEGISISTEGKTIVVEAPAETAVLVHDLCGRLVGSLTGCGSVSVAEGVYLVSGNGFSTQKVEVK